MGGSTKNCYFDDFTLYHTGPCVVNPFDVSGDGEVNVGDVINLQISENKLHLFDGETEITLLHPIPKFSIFGGKVAGGKLDIFGSKVELPEAIKAAIGEADALELEVPPFAVIPGKDFSLKVKKVEEVEGQKLAYLVNGDRYLFALVDDSVKAGQSYSFSLRNDKVRVLVDGQPVLEPIGEQEALEGKFRKRDVGHNAVEFDYVIVINIKSFVVIG